MTANPNPRGHRCVGESLDGVTIEMFLDLKRVAAILFKPTGGRPASDVDNGYGELHILLTARASYDAAGYSDRGSGISLFMTHERAAELFTALEIYRSKR